MASAVMVMAADGVQNGVMQGIAIATPMRKEVMSHT
jgi:hypothetical protein